MHSQVHAALAGNVTSTQDPVQLHMQAVNNLSRCKAMLMANEPMYGFAEGYLAEAKQAVEALRALELTQGM